MDIEAVNLRSSATAKGLNRQNGLYTLLLREPGGTSARIVGAILKAHAAARTPQAALARLADPAIRIVTLTVTEKAYGLDPKTGGLDEHHPAVAHDLSQPNVPQGAIGMLASGLEKRRPARLGPFTPVCCDNLPDNGAILRRLLEFAERRLPGLRPWIEANVPFPSTMVDRIMPSATEATLADAQAILGRRDELAVEAEPSFNG